MSKVEHDLANTRYGTERQAGWVEVPRSPFPIGNSHVPDFDVNLIVESEVDRKKSDWRCLLHDEGGKQLSSGG